MIVYHGSDHIVMSPKFEDSLPENDFGKGFYMTEDEDVAKEYAVRFGKDGYICKYDLDISQTKIFNLVNGKYNILNWLALVLQHRELSMKTPIGINARQYIIDNFEIPTKGYDAIISYKADDSYFEYIEKFLENSISLKQLNNSVKFGKLGRQFVLISKKAVDGLKFVDSEVCYKKDCYPKALNRDMQTRLVYDKYIQKGFDKKDIYMIDILREEMKKDDPRLSAILSL